MVVLVAKETTIAPVKVIIMLILKQLHAKITNFKYCCLFLDSLSKWGVEKYKVYQDVRLGGTSQQQDNG